MRNTVVVGLVAGIVAFVFSSVASRAADSGSQARAISAAAAADYATNLKGLFEHLHANPELSFQEKQTSARIVQELRAIPGVEVTSGIGRHGVVGVIRNGKGPVVMLRADMDGLPVTERNGLPYASKARAVGPDGQETGVMHACGHDVHMTSLVGATRQLVAMKAEWRGTVIVIFQPAEEILGGAAAMLIDGLYTRFPKPDIVLGLHVASHIEPGKFQVYERIANSSSDGVDILVRGVGGHGAAPHTTVDPVVVASELVMALQTLVSRSIDPLEPGVVTVGVIQAGTKRNIISEEARLELTVRADNRETRDTLIAGIQRIANGVARTYGVPEDRMPVVTMRETTPPNINHAESARTLRKALAQSYGEARMSAVPRQGMGAEDFAYYGSPEWGSIPTVFFNVGGSVSDDLRKAPPHHSPLFIIRPEPAVRGGVEGYTTAALTFLGRP
ncbi:MAG: amidohydrolase [Steroidobacteraceae bacterium]